MNKLDIRQYDIKTTKFEGHIMETLIVEQPAKKFRSFYGPSVWIITAAEKHQNSSRRQLDVAHSRIDIHCPSVDSRTCLISYISDITLFLSVVPTNITSVFTIFNFNDSHHTCTTYSPHTNYISLSIVWSSKHSLVKTTNYGAQLLFLFFPWLNILKVSVARKTWK
jgi:hypothetical protein